MLNNASSGLYLRLQESKEAYPLFRKLEFHFTPKHGSWLNMAESNSAHSPPNVSTDVFPTQRPLRAEVAAWERNRNESDSTIDWQFITDDARIKLRQLYLTNHD